MDNTDNAHLGQCNSYLPPGYPDSSNICCKEGCVETNVPEGICTQDTDCCDYGDEIAPAYCSDTDEDGELMNPDDWHCCRDGFYWNPVGLGCEQPEQCYETPCEYLVTGLGYWSDPECFYPYLPRRAEESCCGVEWFVSELSDPTYHYVDVYVYPASEPEPPPI